MDVGLSSTKSRKTAENGYGNLRQKKSTLSQNSLRKMPDVFERLAYLDSNITASRARKSKPVTVPNCGKKYAREYRNVGPREKSSLKINSRNNHMQMPQDEKGQIEERLGKEEKDTLRKKDCRMMSPSLEKQFATHNNLARENVVDRREKCNSLASGTNLTQCPLENRKNSISSSNMAHSVPSKASNKPLDRRRTSSETISNEKETQILPFANAESEDSSFPLQSESVSTEKTDYNRPKTGNSPVTSEFNLSSRKLSPVDPDANPSKGVNRCTDMSARNIVNMISDNDKDICEEEEDDEEFYKVKLQTRLVSYENSTLVIRNTSNNWPKENEQANIDSSQQDHNSLASSMLNSSPRNTYETHDQPAVSKNELTKVNSFRNSLRRLVMRGKTFFSDVRNDYAKTTFDDTQVMQEHSNANCVNSVQVESSEFLSPVAEERCRTESCSEGVDVNSPKCDSAAGQHPNDHPGTPLLPDVQTSFNIDPADFTGKAMVNFSEYFPFCPCDISKEETSISPENTNYAPETSRSYQCSCLSKINLPIETIDLLDPNYCRMWWTITGNFGSILPIDWNKTYTRQKYLPVLNLNEAKKTNLGSRQGSSETTTPRDPDEDEDDVAQDLDLHQLILAGQTEQEPVKSAEEVIREIDDIMQEGSSSSEDEGIESSAKELKDNSEPELQQLPPHLYPEKLKNLGVTELNEAVMELELVIRHYSETLISQLAHRDELEYEKELKNTFISLLLQVQNKRRNFNVEKKKQKKPLGPNGIDPKYLTTVIPYDVGHGPPVNQTIQILIKILTAINEDSPTVPTLLTDYILNVLCPS